MWDRDHLTHTQKAHIGSTYADTLEAIASQLVAHTIHGRPAAQCEHNANDAHTYDAFLPSLDLYIRNISLRPFYSLSSFRFHFLLLI